MSKKIVNMFSIITGAMILSERWLWTPLVMWRALHPPEESETKWWEELAILPL